MTGTPSLSSLIRVERLNYFLGGILCIIAALTRSRSEALGVVVGVALTCINFAFLRRIIGRGIAAAASGQSSNRMLLVMPKMMALMAAVVIVLKFLPISAPAFAIGYSIFVVSVTIETVYSLLMPQPVAASSDGNENNHG